MGSVTQKKLKMVRPETPQKESKEAKIHPILKELTPEPTVRAANNTRPLKYVETKEWTQNTF